MVDFNDDDLRSDTILVPRRLHLVWMLCCHFSWQLIWSFFSILMGKEEWIFFCKEFDISAIFRAINIVQLLLVFKQWAFREDRQKALERTVRTQLYVHRCDVELPSILITVRLPLFVLTSWAHSWAAALTPTATQLAAQRRSAELFFMARPILKRIRGPLAFTHYYYIQSCAQHESVNCFFKWF